MSKNRRRFSDQVKAGVLRRHVSGKIPISNLATELQVHPSLIHLWVKQVLDHAEKAFQRARGEGRKQMKAEDLKSRWIVELEAKLANKHEVISELMEENVKAKKANGEL